MKIFLRGWLAVGRVLSDLCIPVARAQKEASAFPVVITLEGHTDLVWSADKLEWGR